MGHASEISHSVPAPIHSPGDTNSPRGPQASRPLGSFALLEKFPIEIVTLILEAYLQRCYPICPELLFWEGDVSGKQPYTLPGVIGSFGPSSENIALAVAAFFRVNTIRVCGTITPCTARSCPFYSHVRKHPPIATNIRSLSIEASLGNRTDRHFRHDETLEPWRCLKDLLPRLPGLTHLYIRGLEHFESSIRSYKPRQRQTVVFSFRDLLDAPALGYVEVTPAIEKYVFGDDYLDELVRLADVMIRMFADHGRHLTFDGHFRGRNRAIGSS